MKNIIKTAAITLLLLCGIGCEKAFVEPPGTDPEATFEYLWNTFNEEYAPFEERKVDWAAVYRQYRPKINVHSTDEELYSTLTQMLALLDDGHINLTIPNREIFFANKIRREHIDDSLFNLTVVERYLEPGFKKGPEDSYLTGKIKNANIGYIWFDHVGPNFFQLGDFLSKNEQSDGIIIDLRHNQGGDFTYCFTEMGRLTDQKRPVFSSKTKNGKGTNDYTDWTTWHIEPKGTFFNRPIVVLADRYTISAGERAVMAFQTLPNVTVMGDTTNGAHGTMIGRELPNGWFYSLVPQKVKLPDGKSYEGIGLAPDIYHKNILSAIRSGTDQTLQVAIERLK